MFAAKLACRASSSQFYKPNWIMPIASTPLRARGVQEFFVPEKTKVDDFRKAGRAWKASELRLKSFSDVRCLFSQINFLALKTTP
jgi:hypothetical protein